VEPRPKGQVGQSDGTQEGPVSDVQDASKRGRQDSEASRSSGARARIGSGSSSALKGTRPQAEFRSLGLLLRRQGQYASDQLLSANPPEQGLEPEHRRVGALAQRTYSDRERWTTRRLNETQVSRVLELRSPIGGSRVRKNEEGPAPPANGGQAFKR
jgi:hypothetical protein